MEIKSIKKSLRATKIRLLQFENVLFIKGLVRNSLKYSTNSSNFLRNYSIDIPFEGTTVVEFFRVPKEPISKTNNEFETSEYTKSKFNQISQEFFNEPPLCKLLSSKILELNETIEAEIHQFVQQDVEMVL